jgi:hypothetical protein
MRIFAAVTILTTLLLAPIADAWNETGHMTVALIAYRQLSDKQKQQIAEILKAHPHYKLFLTKDLPEGVNEDEFAFVKAAAWPDWVRPSRPGDRMYKDTAITHFHHGPWHYIDIAYIADEKTSHIDMAKLPNRQEPNILTALDLNAKLLQAEDTKPQDRAVALSWVEHLIGDVHQPLHAATLYSAEFPTGDQGGNLLDVRANGYVMKLHGFWDDLVGTSDSYVQVEFLASNILAESQCDPTHMSEYKSDTTFSSWADESFRYAVGVVYLNGHLRGLPLVANATTRPAEDDVPTLPESYMQTARELAERRIALAGYRLADQLKAMLNH